jgi:hypothetical protein
MSKENAEAVRYDIGLTFDFVRACINDPLLLEQLGEDGGELVFVEKDRPIRPGRDGEKRHFIRVVRSFEVISPEEVMAGDHVVHKTR